MANTAIEAVGTLHTADETVSLLCMGYGTVGIQISGTWAGTISFEATLDAANWVALNVIKTNGSSMVTSATSNAAYLGSVAGCRIVRARMSSFTSGTAQIQLTAVGTGGGSGGSGGGGGGGAVTIADGDDVAEGSTTDAAVTSDANGTVNAHIRGLVTILSDVWSSASHYLKVSLQASAAVIGHVITDSGSTTAVTQATATNLNAAVVGTGTAGSAAGGVLTIQGVSSMTKVLVTPDANAAINNAQWGGTNVITGGTAGGPAVGGIQAHDAADSGNNPVKLGAKAQSAEVSAVASGDIANLITDLVGKLIVLPYANPENFVSGTITSAMTGTTSTSLVAAPASGLRNYITQITVSNGSTTVPTDILIQDGSGGTTLYVIPAPAGTGTGTGAAGATITFPVPLRQPTTATAIYCANVTTGSSTKVSASGYKGA